MITQFDRNRIVAEAESWLGTPWHHQASVKGVGVDCALFIRAVYAACQIIPAFRVDKYAEQWALHRSEEKFLATLNRFGKQVIEPQPGDAVVFLFGRCFSHGGIVIDWPLIIHAFKPANKVVLEDVNASGFCHRPRRFYEVG